MLTTVQYQLYQERGGSTLRYVESMLTTVQYELNQDREEAVPCAT
jgi:hypothetical protein